MTRADNPSSSLSPSVRMTLDAVAAAYPDVAIIGAAAGGDVMYWSRGAASLYGWSRDSAVGRNILDLTPAVQSRSDAAGVLRSLDEGGTWQGEMVVKGRDGRPFRAAVADFVVQGVGSSLIFGVSTHVDQTDRLNATRGVIEAQIRAALADDRQGDRQ